MWQANYRSNLGTLVKYLRVTNDLNQSDMAEILNCGKTRIVRIEDGKLDLYSKELMKISRHFDLASEDFAYGYITSPKYKKNDMQLFKIPKTFSEDAFSFGRTSYLHVENFKTIFGYEKFKQFCESNRVDPLYFTNLNNPINIRFNLMILQEMIRGKVLQTKQNLIQYTSQFRNSCLHHQHNLKQYNRRQGVSRLKALTENISDYETNHKYEFLWDNRKNRFVDIRVSVGSHVDKSLYHGPWLNNFILEHYIPTYLSTFMGGCNEVEVSRDKLSGNESCIVRIRQLGEELCLS